MIDPLIQTLRGISHFAALPDEDLDTLARAFSVEDHPDGHVFAREGHHADGAFLLLFGTIVITKRRGNEEDELNRLGPGSLFGLVALMDDGRRSATCAAHDTVRVAWMPQAAFQLLLRSQSPAARAVQSAVAAQLCLDFRHLVADLREALEASA